MFKKISFLLLAAGILVTGYIALDKLNYWERSVRIFSIRNQNFDGRRGRGQFRNEDNRDRGRRVGIERPGMLELPDSIRVRFREEGSPVMRERNISDSLSGRITTTGRRQMTRDRNTSDSLRQLNRINNQEISGRDSFESGTRNSRDRGRGNSPRGRKIYLRNVLWFVAVFSSFTVLTIYFDKVINKVRKKRLR